MIYTNGKHMNANSKNKFPVWLTARWVHFYLKIKLIFLPLAAIYIKSRVAINVSPVPTCNIYTHLSMNRMYYYEMSVNVHNDIELRCDVEVGMRTLCMRERWMPGGWLRTPGGSKFVNDLSAYARPGTTSICSISTWKFNQLTNSVIPEPRERE